jgi:hypothetical protein
MPEEKHRVLCQKWLESERGWGTRPDGYSLHVNEEDCKTFVKEYWDNMPDEVPEEYSKPDGTPYWCEVDEKTYEMVKKSKNGILRFETPPGSGGTDGWIPLGKGGSGYIPPK